ncbi:MAG: hypothetical protein ACKO2G_16645 [Verrucomicrobiales bacterium]
MSSSLPSFDAPLTPWYTRRMLIMLAMFGLFAAYFAYDWKIGYPKKAEIYQTYLSYAKDGDEGLRKWADVARQNGWDDYEDEKKLEPFKVDDAKIAQQMWGMVVCSVATLIILVLAVRAVGTRMALREGKLILPGTEPIDITEIRRVDTRKWMSKGLASIWYEKNGTQKKGVIDGLKYGGFKGEKPYVPDQILEYVVKNFKGELIELEELPPEEPAEGA